MKRSQAGVDRSTALMQRVVDRVRADERIVWCDAISNTRETRVAAFLVEVGQTGGAQRLDALRGRANVDECDAVLVGHVHEVVARAAHRTDAVHVDARPKVDRHQARDAPFGRRLVHHVGVGEAELRARSRDVVNHRRKRIWVELERGVALALVRRLRHERQRGCQR